MNAVVHAGGGQGSVYADPARGVVQVWVRDAGKGISEEALHRAILEKGFSSAGSLGHGFWMMLKTADRIYLLTGPEGTTVVLEQERTSPEPDWMRHEALAL
jgi:serine/threonine-protein kinase RsbT